MSSAKILIVDDELIMRESLAGWLQRDGHSVQTAPSGEDALEKLKEMKFDIMLVDIKMEGISGLDVLCNVKENDPDIASQENGTLGQSDDPTLEEDNEEAEEEPAAIVDFDAVFIPDSPGKVGQIVPQLAYFDIKDVYLLGTNLWHSDSLIKIADQYVQGAVMPDGFFAQSTSPRVQEFVKVFEETYQETPDFVAAVVYDSAMILFNVVSRPHIRYRTEIRDELFNLENFPGITGITKFDENGDVLKKMHLLRIKGKRFVELE